VTIAELRGALGLGLIPGTNVIVRGQLGESVRANILDPFYGVGGSFTISSATVTPTDDLIKIDGRAPFLAADLPAIKRFADLPVHAEFQLNAGELAATIVFTLPDDWTFNQSFPLLSKIDDPDSPAEQTLFEYLGSRGGRIEKGRFIFRNVAGEVPVLIDNISGSLASKPGLNVAVKWTPNAVLGLSAQLTGTQTSFVLSGSVKPGAPGKVPEGDVPWSIDTHGINLRANLVISAAVGSLRLEQVAFRAYSPIDDEVSAPEPGHVPMMGFSGALRIPSAGNAAAVVNARKFPGVPEVLITGDLINATLGNLADSLLDLGASSTATRIPVSVRSQLSQLTIGLERVTAGVVIANPFKVNFIGARISLGSGLTWPPPNNPGLWPFQSSASLNKVQLNVGNPFGSPALSAVITGKVTVLGSDFAITAEAEANGFRFSAEQTTPATLSLQSLFQQLRAPLPPPPEISVQDLRFSVDNGGAFHLSMSIVPGVGWEIEPGLTVPNLHVSVTNEAWHFSGESESGIDVAKLARKLARQIDNSADFGLPQALESLSVRSFSFSRTSGPPARHHVELKGAAVIDGLADPVEMSLTIEIEGQGSNARKQIKGLVTVAGVVFDVEVEVDAASAASTVVFAFRPQTSPDESGERPANINRFRLSELLAKLASADVAAKLPSLDIDLAGAFLAIRKVGNQPARVLFGLDIGAELDLSKELETVQGVVQKSPGLLVRLGLPNQPLKLGFRLLASTAAHTPADVAAINQQLSKRNLAALPSSKRQGDNAIAKGLDATLRLGNTVVGRDPVADTQPAQGPQGAAAPAPAESSSEVHWFVIQRKLGPIQVKRIGVSFNTEGTDKLLCFSLDAAVTAGPLELGADGLTVCNPVNRFAPTFGLDGLSLGYKQGTVEISGAFLKKGDDFSGAALIQAGKLSLTAIGAYHMAEPRSLFVFASLTYPLGGPSFFFVTGLAAGFGYNRDLILPDIGGVRSFPFVKAVIEPSTDPNPGGAILAELDAKKAVPTREGSYWIAAGIRFTSFQLVDSFALLFVKLGNELEFSLLGVSTMTLPKGSTGANRYVNVELAFRVSVKPNEGEFAAEALLTNNSFALHPDCRLSGGFAFYVWFSGTHEGDFVLTLGGYHPLFRPPAHYPVVPRLGINWSIPPHAVIKGEAYFALTPSCIMAGGLLEATYNDGSLFASFRLSADFLIRWKPFYYIIDVSFSIQVALQWETLLGTLVLSTQLNAALHITGPEFYAMGHVDWGAISVDLELGDPNDAAGGTIGWNDFRDAFLPKPPASQNKGWTGSDVAIQLCQANIEFGLDREFENAATLRKEWVVRPDEVVFSTQTAMPATAARMGSTSTNDVIVGNAVGVRPMGGGGLVSVHRVTIVNLSTGVEVPLGTEWVPQARTGNLPKELWDVQYSAKEPKPSAEVMTDCLVGLASLRPNARPMTGPREIPLKAFAFETLPDGRLKLRRSDLASPVGAITELGPPITGVISQQQIFASIRSTVEQPAIRSTIIKLATTAGFSDLTDDPLPKLAAGADNLFQFAPMQGSLGSTGSAAPATVTPEVPIEPPPPDPLVIQTTVELVYNSLLTRPQANAAVDSTPRPLIGEQRYVLPPAPGAAPAVPRHDVIPGRVLRWTIRTGDPRKPARNTSLDVSNASGMRFRVAALDRFRRTLRDGVVTETTALPPDTAHCVVMALPAVAGSAAVTTGWTADTAMIEAAPNVFLGEDCIVNTQASDPASRPDEDAGLVRGSQLATENRVSVEQAGANVLQGGFVRTLLPDRIKTLAVMVKRSIVAGASNAASIVEVQLADGGTLHLQPRHVFRGDANQVVLLYAVPAGLAPASLELNRMLGVLSQAAGEWEVQGVLGIDAKIADVRAAWQDFQLKPAAPAGGSAAVAAPASVAILAA
jgi:hypothetical protein